LVTDGESDVDESLLTGESTDIAKKPGDQVVAGSINRAGTLTVQVSKIGSDTALAGVMKLVADAQASKSGVQMLADRAASWLFYVALAAALITLAAWWLINPDDPAFIVERVVTVLVIACPHALGLAIPLVAQISTTLGAKNGILVRSRAALEDARRVQVVLFDKTGTLTEGRQGVTAVAAAKGHSADDVLALAAAVEAKSEHPIARAIVAEAKSRKLKVARSSKFAALAGLGAEATVAEKRVTIASQRHVTARGLSAPPDLVHAAADARAAGAGHVFVVVENEVIGVVTLSDVVRPESAEAVARLKKAGIRVAMLTGDSHAVANAVAAELGIDEVFAEVLPGQKADPFSTPSPSAARPTARCSRTSSGRPATTSSESRSRQVCCSVPACCCLPRSGPCSCRSRRLLSRSMHSCCAASGWGRRSAIMSACPPRRSSRLLLPSTRPHPSASARVSDQR
jgi:P-type Cu2+ transporter